MTDTALIDRIVRDVLATLNGDAAPAAPAVAGHDGALVLDDAVLTAESLAARVNGHASIVIGAKTILTPTARDFLRQRGLSVSRGSKEGAASKVTTDTARWLALIVEEYAAARRAAEDAGRAGWRHGTIGCWKAATDRAVDVLRRGDADGISVVSTHTAAVGCRANRHAHVRAAVVDDVHGVKAARETIGVNLVVIDPAGRTFVELRNLLREFAAGGVPKVPTGWED